MLNKCIKLLNREGYGFDHMVIAKCTCVNEDIIEVISATVLKN